MYDGTVMTGPTETGSIEPMRFFFVLGLAPIVACSAPQIVAAT